MEKKTSLSKAIELEREIGKFLDEALAGMHKECAGRPMSGVKRLCTKPLCYLVSSKAIMLDPLKNMVPEYWIPEAQADIVRKHLQEAKTAGEFKRRLKEMVRTELVFVDNARYRLNGNTLDVLKKYLEQGAEGET